MYGCMFVSFPGVHFFTDVRMLRGYHKILFDVLVLVSWGKPKTCDTL